MEILELPVWTGRDGVTWPDESATSYRDGSHMHIRYMRVYGQKLMSGPFRLGVCRSVNILLIFESRHCADDDYLLAGKKQKNQKRLKKNWKIKPNRSRGEPRLTLKP